jgi:hypothetical protein
LIVDGVKGLDDALPGNAYRLHTLLMEFYVAAELCRREAVRDELEGYGQKYLPGVGGGTVGSDFPG